MILLRLLNPQGIAGVAASLCLGLLLLFQAGETRHWKKQSGQFEQLYRSADAAMTQTVANYRAAADAARQGDLANAARVRAEQSAIDEETNDAFEKRLADARARAGRLRVGAPAAANTRAGGATRMSGLSAAAGRADQAAGADGLPPADALTATEQAIQLDALIQWVKRQHAVDPAAVPVANGS